MGDKADELQLRRALARRLRGEALRHAARFLRSAPCADLPSAGRAGRGVARPTFGRCPARLSVCLDGFHQGHWRTSRQWHPASLAPMVVGRVRGRWPGADRRLRVAGRPPGCYAPAAASGRGGSRAGRRGARGVEGHGRSAGRLGGCRGTGRCGLGAARHVGPDRRVRPAMGLAGSPRLRGHGPAGRQDSAGPALVGSRVT